MTFQCLCFSTMGKKERERKRKRRSYLYVKIKIPKAQSLQQKQLGAGILRVFEFEKMARMDACFPFCPFENAKELETIETFYIA